jgi:hypothetical protein
MTKPALGPKVILSAGVRPAIKRAGVQGIPGTITHSQMAARGFAFHSYGPIPRPTSRAVGPGCSPTGSRRVDSAAATRLGMERPRCARALDEPASRKVRQVSKAPRLAASLPARPIQPIQDDDCRSRRDERKESRYHPVSPRKFFHLSDPQMAALVGGLFHCPNRFQMTASDAISSMHMMTRRPMRFIEYSVKSRQRGTMPYQRSRGSR